MTRRIATGKSTTAPSDAPRESVAEGNMNLIKIEGEDGYWLAINADQIEHVRYRPAIETQVAQVEIMFAGNPVRTFFEGRLAEQFWELLGK